MKGRYLLDAHLVKIGEGEKVIVDGDTYRVYEEEFLIGNNRLRYHEGEGGEKFKLGENENVSLPDTHLTILANLGLQAIKDLTKKGIKFRIKNGDLELL